MPIFTLFEGGWVGIRYVPISQAAIREHWEQLR